MLKNNKGFSLAECMAALLVLTIGIQFLIPIFTKSYFEAKTLNQHEDALTILHNTLINWAENGLTPPETTSIHSTEYNLEWSNPSPFSAKLCVQWALTQTRRGTECGEIKR